MKKLNAARDKDELPCLIDIGRSICYTIPHLEEQPMPTLEELSIHSFFCATRWIEDEPVADRLVHIWPHDQANLITSKVLFHQNDHVVRAMSELRS